MLKVKGILMALCVKQKYVDHISEGFSPLLGIAVSRRAFPRDLIYVVLRSKNGIHHEFQVVASRWVAVQVNAAGGLEDTVKFNEANGHHDEIGHHIVAAQERQQCLHQISQLTWPARDRFLVDRLRFQAPLPCILKGGNLRGGFLAALFLEKDVIVGVGVKGRIKVNQVNAGVRDVITKNTQIIAKVEFVCTVHFRRAYHNLRRWRIPRQSEVTCHVRSAL